MFGCGGGNSVYREVKAYEWRQAHSQQYRQRNCWLKSLVPLVVPAAVNFIDVPHATRCTQYTINTR